MVGMLCVYYQDLFYLEVNVIRKKLGWRELVF